MVAKELTRYLKIWWRSAIVNFSVLTTSRLDFVTFVLGKLIRMGFFLVFVVALFEKTPQIAGYGKGEVLLFFAVMNFVDIVVQLLWYRGMTDLQRLVRTGDFDLVLAKPISPLFWTAFRVFDFFDLITVPAAVLFLAYAFGELGVALSVSHLLLGAIVLLLGLITAFAINLILASLTFWITEMHNAWWIYRDTVYVARFPPEIYPRLVRLAFTFVVPILVIVTFPTKAMLGLLAPASIAWAAAAAILFLALAVLTWRKALRTYTSASA